ncbi:MAG: DUF2783 domain-containing protein [Granulosicoccus sp.]
MNNTTSPAPASLLNTAPKIHNPDGFYDELLDAHTEFSDEQSADFNARLILLLCNHIGEREILSEALSTKNSVRISEAAAARSQLLLASSIKLRAGTRDGVHQREETR